MVSQRFLHHLTQSMDNDGIEIDDVGDKREEKNIEMIHNTRRIVKMFRRSALKKEILQKYVLCRAGFRTGTPALTRCKD